MRQFILFLVCLGSVYVLNAQCSSSVSANGFDYTVDISLETVGIQIEACQEGVGFNYDLEINYSITLSGADAINLDDLST